MAVPGAPNRCRVSPELSLGKASFSERFAFKSGSTLRSGSYTIINMLKPVSNKNRVLNPNP